MKLSRKVILELKPTGKRQEIPDAQAQGLYLVIQPAPSGAKSWAMRFRQPDGKHGKLALGLFDASNREAADQPVMKQPLTLDEARVLAATVNLQRAKGVDVIARQRDDKKTGAQVAFPVHVRDYLEDAKQKNRQWRAKSQMLGYRYPLKGDGEPEIIKGGLSDRWRDRAISEIDGDEIFALVEDARHNGIPGMMRKTTGPSDARARHFDAALGTLFSWLHRKRRIKLNPYQGIFRPPALKPRDHVLNIRTSVRNADELRWLWAATVAMGFPYGPMVQLLLLTGCRRREIARMEWRELDDDLSMLRLPAERVKNKLPHDVPMSPMAQEILSGIPRIGERYVFTTIGNVPVSNYGEYKAKLDALMLREAVKEGGPNVKIADWRIHDLRRSCATGMGEIGVQPHIVEAVLNHVSGSKGGVAGVYNRATYEAEKRDALNRWAAYIQRVVGGAQDANVVPLKIKSK